MAEISAPPPPQPDVIEVGSVEELARQLAETGLKAQDYWDRLVRLQAEFENHKKRTEKDLQNAHKFALERFAKELLTVMDSLELGIQASVSSQSDVEKLREGMELTLRQLAAVFEKFGIQVIDPLGDKFNPDLHQAMAAQPAEAVEPNTVVKVFQKGYSLNDRLLRPAMVIIAQQVTGSRIDQQA
ncbi:nucleotide exchange factor GrpE [Candidatus Woesearchaeota archaeon]|nr:nucleotide exchange factor GrpE [Candidatus Woesearchaeota archaeon]